MKIIFLLLLVTIFTLPFHFALNPAQGYDLIVTRVVGGSLLGVTLLFCLLKKRCFSPIAVQGVFLISFLAVAGLSLFMTEQPFWGMRKFIFFLTLVPFFFLVVYFVLENWNARLSIQRALVWGAAMAATVGLIQFFLQFIIGLDQTLTLWRTVSALFLGESLGLAVIAHNSWLVNVAGTDLFRVVAFFPDPHICAFYFGMTAPLAIGLFAKTGRSVYMWIALVLLVADLLTFSRGGYMGLVFGLIAFLALFFHQLRAWHKIAIGLFVSMGILLLVIPSNPISQRLVSSFDLREGSNVERLVNWQQAGEVIVESPFVGVGLGGYISHIDPRADYRTPIYAHNLYLDIMAEMGIVGLFLWLSFLLAVVVAFFRARSEPLMIAGGISVVIFMAHSFFETPLFSVHIFTLLMIIAGLSYCYKKRS